MTAPVSEALLTSPASSAATEAPPVSVASSQAAPESVASVAAPPESYALKLAPEVKGVDAAIVERTAAIARAQGLGNEAAQSLLNSVVAEVNAQEQARLDAWKPGGTQWAARDAEWRAAALADREIGGSPEKLATSVELAQKVMTKFGGEDVTTFLKESGLGSHPAALKLLAKIGAAMSESTLVVGASTTQSGGKSIAQRLYGADGTGKPQSE